MKTRKKPNYYANRYNQWTIAGKIAVVTRAIDIYDDKGNVDNYYKTNNGNIHYSLIGQQYLQQLGLVITEL